MKQFTFQKEVIAPVDLLNEAQHILSFVQAWTELDPEMSPSTKELAGVYFTIQAARELIGAFQNWHESQK